MTRHIFSDEKLFTVSQVLRLLNISRHRLIYLFDSRKLRVEDFQTLPNGHKVFTESDLEKIKRALWDVGAK